jgi:phosphoribosylglycinamide formyltransferase-1
MPLRCLVLASGRGSNFQALLEASARPQAPFTLKALITDRTPCGAEALAARWQVPAECLPYRDFSTRAAFDETLAHRVRAAAPDLVLCAGFMRVLGPSFFDACPVPLLNIHPSLLPAHRGLHTHSQVLAAGDAFHGASVHWVTRELDGGPLLAQARLAVAPEDTEESLAARVLKLEHALYPQALAYITEGGWNAPPLTLGWDGEALVPWP